MQTNAENLYRVIKREMNNKSSHDTYWWWKCIQLLSAKNLEKKKSNGSSIIWCILDVHMIFSYWIINFMLMLISFWITLSRYVKEIKWGWRTWLGFKWHTIKLNYGVLKTRQWDFGGARNRICPPDYQLLVFPRNKRNFLDPVAALSGGVYPISPHYSHLLFW
jgi:hypothetical protein